MIKWQVKSLSNFTNFLTNAYFSLKKSKKVNKKQNYETFLRIKVKRRGKTNINKLVG